MTQKIKPAPAWYRYDAAGVIRRMQSHQSGLSAEEARRRLAGIGPNQLPPRKSKSFATRLLLCLSDAFASVLLAAAMLAGLAGRWMDTGVILAVVALNALINWRRQNRKEAASVASARLPQQTLVRRDGEAQQVNACELVPGDIVMLRAGDKAPADIRLIEEQNLQVDEALLTGVVAAVAKQTAAIDSEWPTAGDNMLFFGSSIVSGSATGVVVATGERTELGKIERLLTRMPARRTPLLRQLDKFGKVFFLAIAALIIFLFCFSLLRHNVPMHAMMQTLAGLAIAAVPAGLPTIIILTLTLGARRMAKKKVAIHSLSAVEKPGSVSVICCDMSTMMASPRPAAIKAIADCQSAGVQVKIIADDRPETAQMIGWMLGAGESPLVLSGGDLAHMSDTELARIVSRYDIFTHIDALHKLRLVAALQSQGEVVAVTGSGLRDAPALKQADVGIATKVEGGETTAAAADITLADGCFATLVGALGEGRRIQECLSKTVLFTLPLCLAQTLLFIVAMLTGKATPLMPLQVLWINMAISIALALSLAFGKAEPPIARRQPNESWLFWRVAFAGILIMLSMFALEEWLQASGYAPRFIHTFLLQAIVTAQWVYLLFCREPGRFSLNTALLRDRAFWLASGAVALLQLAIVTLPGMRRLFGATPLSPENWLMTLLVGALLFAAFKLEKPLTRRWRQASAENL